MPGDAPPPAPRRTAALSLLGFAAVLAGFVALSVRTARVGRLYHDEVYTHHLSRFGSVGELWGWLAAGTDLNPPLNYVLVRAGTALFGDSPAGLRAASVAAYAAAAGLLFLHLRRRHRSETAGWLGGLFLLACNLPYYAVIARAYAPLVCAAAGVLFFRSLADADRRAVRWAGAAGLAVALAAGVYLHYFGVLLYLPVAAGELGRCWAARRVRPNWAVCLAAAAAAGLTLPLLPLMQTAREFRAVFWAKPGPDSLELVYAGLLVNLAFPLAAVAGLCAWAGRPAPAGPDRPADRAAEVGLLALPAAAVAVGVLVTQAFDKRYAVPGYLGAAAVFAALAVPFLLGRRGLTAAALGGLAAWWLAGTELRYRKAAAEEREVDAVVARVERELLAGRTVVVYDQLLFTPLAAALPGYRDRLLYLSVPAHSPADYTVQSDDRNLSALARLSGAFGVHRLDEWTPPADGFVAVGGGWQADALAARGLRPAAVVTDYRRFNR